MESEIKDIIDDKNSKSYWIHRTQENFDAEKPQKIIEQSEESIHKYTTYFGEQTLDKVIPHQYLKCAIISICGEPVVISNPEYERYYKVQDGIYNQPTVDEVIRLLSVRPYDFDSTEKAISMVIANSEYENTTSEIGKILEIINENLDINDRNVELYDGLMQKKKK